MSNKLIIFLIVFMPFLIFCQEHKIPEESWKIHKDTLNHPSGKDWIVYMEDGKIYARNGEIKDEHLPFEIKYDPNYPNRFNPKGYRSVARVKDGYLVGCYAGEWGGGLYWFSTDGKKSYTISNTHVLDFIVRENKLYALQGLNSGLITEIRYDNNVWKTIPYISIDSQPFCIAKDANNNFLVGTINDLLKIDPTGKNIASLFKKKAGYPIFPTSIIVRDNVAYMGVRGGILKYNLKTGKTEWLIPE